jgi:hypothetical protein
MQPVRCYVSLYIFCTGVDKKYASPIIPRRLTSWNVKCCWCTVQYMAEGCGVHRHAVQGIHLYLALSFPRIKILPLMCGYFKLTFLTPFRMKLESEKMFTFFVFYWIVLDDLIPKGGLEWKYINTALTGTVRNPELVNSRSAPSSFNQINPNPP